MGLNMFPKLIISSPGLLFCCLLTAMDGTPESLVWKMDEIVPLEFVGTLENPSGGFASRIAAN